MRRRKVQRKTIDAAEKNTEERDSRKRQMQPRKTDAAGKDRRSGKTQTPRGKRQTQRRKTDAVEKDRHSRERDRRSEER